MKRIPRLLLIAFALSLLVHLIVALILRPSTSTPLSQAEVVSLERRPATTSKSYGYHRAGVLAAFINAGTLAAFTLYIFVEAFQRLRSSKSAHSCGCVLDLP